MEKGKVQFIMMRYGEAAGTFAAALAYKDVDKPETLYNLGLSYLSQGKYSEALVHFDEGLKIKDNLYEVDILVSRGIALSKLGKKEDALTSFKKAVELAPKDAEVLNNVGSVYFEEGQYELAAEQYLKALEEKPNDIEVLSNLGNTLTKLKDYQHAWIAFEEALKINPTNVGVIENYLLCLLDAKLIDRYSELMEKSALLPKETKDRLNALAEEYRITLGIRHKKPLVPKKKRAIVNTKLKL
eukprot:TRINITY_DN8387_c0_g1_i5.p1 TRINITY_DN8387_c0_g1~~TRINITY_DN8387_c0_g1_i5.p1  ORF type:complete len:242 (-),score=81.39 TRINITY_DN8387_c0_g1_i5:63-788(-)